MGHADDTLARTLADEAGAALLRLRQEMGFSDGKALKDAGDQLSHELLMKRLAEERPDDAVLSEEGKDDPVRLSAARVWIVDPLDGTREFSEEGRTDWAVHVALWQDGELVAGAVALPAQGHTLATDVPIPTPTSTSAACRLAASRTRPPAVVNALVESLPGELVPMGSAGAKVAAVVTGEVDAYVHAGGQYEWDSAAPVAVARHAGLYVSRLDGSDPAYNQPDPSLPDLVVCRPEWVDGILRGISAAEQ